MIQKLKDGRIRDSKTGRIMKDAKIRKMRDGKFSARKTVNSSVDTPLKSQSLSSAQKEAEQLGFTVVENSDTGETWQKNGTWKNLGY